ncbi:aldolase [Diplocarpon rosae]|nr:aldolase [Diplocarpon rosae]
MSPHHDAPSPSGSFTQTSHVSFRPVTGSGPRNSRSQPNNRTDPESALHVSSSANSTTSLETEVHVSRPLVPGVYVPTVCFFDPVTEELDRDSIGTHAVRLATAGVTGLATQGSNGEAVHLTHAERQAVTQTTRSALDAAGFSHLPIIVGCGAQSVRETIQYCQEAYAAGGDYALVLPPSYYAPLFSPASASVIEYFHAVAGRSPIPLLIYNYPGALNRIVAATRSAKPHSLSAAPSFLVLGGSADFTLQSLIGGGHGILAGLANLSPKACLEILRLYREGKLAEAQQLQEVVARGDWAAIQGGIVATKAAMESWLGYGGYARSPLPRPTSSDSARWKDSFQELVAVEKSF